MFDSHDLLIAPQLAVQESSLILTRPSSTVDASALSVPHSDKTPSKGPFRGSFQSILQSIKSPIEKVAVMNSSSSSSSLIDSSAVTTSTTSLSAITTMSKDPLLDGHATTAAAIGSDYWKAGYIAQLRKRVQGKSHARDSLSTMFGKASNKPNQLVKPLVASVKDGLESRAAKALLSPTSMTVKWKNSKTKNEDENEDENDDDVEEEEEEEEEE